MGQVPHAICDPLELFGSDSLAGCGMSRTSHRRQVTNYISIASCVQGCVILSEGANASHLIPLQFPFQLAKVSVGPPWKGHSSIPILAQ